MNDRTLTSNERVSDDYLQATLHSISTARALDSQLISTAFFRRLLTELIERRSSDETSPPHDIEASVGCGNCVEAHYVLTAAGIADGDLAEKIDDLVSERDAALEALRRIRDQSAQGYEDPEQEAYASRDIARKALEGVPQSETPAADPTRWAMPPEPKTWMPAWLREFHCQCETTGDAAGKCVACQAANLIEQSTAEKSVTIPAGCTYPACDCGEITKCKANQSKADVVQCTCPGWSVDPKCPRCSPEKADGSAS